MQPDCVSLRGLQHWVTKILGLNVWVCGKDSIQLP